MSGHRQQFEYHPVYGYRFVPGLKARMQHEAGGYLLRVNDAGFRCDHEFTKARTAGKRRVLLFGDSFTAGDGVSNGKRFSDVLESLVPGLEVYNLGLSGTGTDQQYLAWREVADVGTGDSPDKGLECDLLLLAVQVENIRRIASRFRTYANEHGRDMVYAKPYYELEGDRLVLHHCPPDPNPMEVEKLDPSLRGHVDSGGRLAAVREVVNALGLKDLVQRVTRYQPLPDFDKATNPAWLLMRAILTKWITEHRAQGAGVGSAPVMIAPIPLYMYVEGHSDPSGYQQRFAELANETGAVLHDPLPDLLKAGSEQRRGFRFPKDVHPTPAGHEAIARSLAPAVARVLGT